MLREAARPVLTDTVYGRHKHPFLTPPAALSPGERLHELVQETLRGPALAVAAVLRPGEGRRAAGLACRRLDDGARTAIDPVLMILLSACVLQERFGLS